MLEAFQHELFLSVINGPFWNDDHVSIYPTWESAPASHSKENYNGHLAGSFHCKCFRFLITAYVAESASFRKDNAPSDQIMTRGAYKVWLQGNQMQSVQVSTQEAKFVLLIVQEAD